MKIMTSEIKVLTTVHPLLLWLAGPCLHFWRTAPEVPPSRSPSPPYTFREPGGSKGHQRGSVRAQKESDKYTTPVHWMWTSSGSLSPASSRCRPRGQSSWGPRRWSTRRSLPRHPPRETPCSSLEVAQGGERREDRHRWGDLRQRG